MAGKRLFGINEDISDLDIVIIVSEVAWMRLLLKKREIILSKFFLVGSLAA